MNKQEIEKAIDGLGQSKPILQAQLLKINHEGLGKQDAKELGEHFNTAIKCMEKQIPKKAKYHHKVDGECALVICPNCENRLTVARYIFPLDRYCKECGQRFVVSIKDWSVEE